MRRKLLILLAATAVLYSLGYGTARWRKSIVMGEYRLKEQPLLIR